MTRVLAGAGAGAAAVGAAFAPAFTVGVRGGSATTISACTGA